MYDKHPIAGGDIQCQAPNSWSRYTTPFGDIINKCVTCSTFYQHVRYLLRIQQYPVNNTCNKTSKMQV